MRPLSRLITSTALVGLGTLAWASLVERNLYTLRHLEVPVLPAGAGQLRLLHLSDLHLTPGQHHKRNWVAALAEEKPDLVMVTGDNLGSADAVPSAIQALEPLLRYPGAFVFGSNDYYGPVIKNPFGYFAQERTRQHGVELPSAELRDYLTGSGWADLSNARAAIEVNNRAIALVGVDDPHLELDRYPGQDADEGVADPEILRIGLTHSPEPRVIHAMAAEGCQLVLAGHTHGGQVRVPGIGALVTNCGLHRSMARGLHRWPGSPTYLHVSAGLGTHPTAPVRFACLPEASMLILTAR